MIGNASAPTFVEKGDLELDQVLAIVRDPNVAVAIEDENGAFHTLAGDEREAIEAGVVAELQAQQAEREALLEKASIDPAKPTTETDTVGPQGDGMAPGTEAPQAGGPDATADASLGSAAEAGTTPAAPAAKPSGRTKGGSGGKPAKAGT